MSPAAMRAIFVTNGLPFRPLPVQGDERHLARTVVAQRRSAHAEPAAGIADHPPPAPLAARAEAAAPQMRQDRPPAGQAELAAMGMAAEIKRIAFGFGVIGHLGRMDERDAES